MILSRIYRCLGMVHLVAGVLVAALLLSDSSPRRIGDNVQIALPLVAWGCAITDRSGGDYALRFFSMLAIAHGSKAALGDAEINQRPNGGDKGFPSAHTAAATFGASSLVHACLRDNLATRAVVVIAAAFVGSSRIEAGAHDIWQVLAGALLGWGCDRLLRGQGRQGPFRHRQLRARGAIFRVFRTSSTATVRSWLFPVLIALPGSLAFANPAMSETEISLYGGIQSVLDGTTNDALGTREVDWEGRSFELPPYWGVRATWWGANDVGFGAEINHAKAYARNSSALGYDRLEFTDGLNLATLNIWRRWTGESRLVPYVGVGLGLAIPHVDVQPTGEARTFGYQLTGPAAQVVSGVSWRLDQRWSVFGEWKATWSRNKADLDSGGQLEAEIITNAVNLGMGFRF